MTDPAAPFRVWTKRSVLAIVAACLLLLSLIGFLVFLNYQSQIALRESALNRFRLELEKRSASLEYFFSERKYDLSSLVLSREINTYFTNKALGRSEQYGLKVNLFMIQQLFQKALEERKTLKTSRSIRILSSSIPWAAPWRILLQPLITRHPSSRN